ncbi:hypothetical protein [uncultured Pseudoalteromonas sp.]|uniref:hypothetical protein n=1 Tax=uncultured Pseudoalteromonas sp. TaxID=114053 RepID=UPI00259AC582|nr:hypothetical protein [uncultured Pseudoalteromonas sp.]
MSFDSYIFLGILIMTVIMGLYSSKNIKTIKNFIKNQKNEKLDKTQKIPKIAKETSKASLKNKYIKDEK